MKAKTFFVSLSAIAGLYLSANSNAQVCNPKAQVHQQRAANIKLAMDLNGRIPSAEEEAFMLCMMPEKEDKQAFQQRVQSLRAYAAAQPAREAAARQQQQERAQAMQQQQAEQQRQAAAAAASIDSKMQACETLVGKRQGEVASNFVFSCKAAWQQARQATCSESTIPCGGQCVDPNSNGNLVPICDQSQGKVIWSKTGQ